MKKNYKIIMAFIVMLGLSITKFDAQVLNTESFDGTTFVPAGWTHLTTSSSAIWSRITGGSWPVQSPHSGPGEADFNSFSAFSGVDAIITPPFSLINNTTGAALSFWMYRDNGYNSTPDKVDVYYNTAANLTGATLLGTVNRACGLAPTVSSNGWYQYSYTIPNTVTSGSVYIIFNATSAYGDDIYLDDVSWTSYPTPCSGIPGANTVITPTYAICPGAGGNLSLATSYTVGGITYQWQSSTVSAVGPFVPVPTATNALYAASNLTVSAYYNAVISCTNPGGSSYTTSAGQVTVSPVITNTVPYFENFDAIGGANFLPNCSWKASNLPNTCLTYTSSNSLGRIPRSGTSFASFYYSPVGANYFYTNGIYLTTGITYSAALWFETEYYGYTNWTDLSILYGTTQTSVGLIPIASTNGPAVSNVYRSLSHTFTVATTGLYYIAVRGTAGSGSAQYLSWDDLSITIPCTPNSLNTPSISLAANSTTICAGNSINLTVTGADTFTWNTGSNSSVLTDSPVVTTTYNVIGTNSLSGCTSTMSQIIVVNPVPVMFIVSDKPSVCSGSPANITALGVSTCTWSNGSNNLSIVVSPIVPTTYTVIGSNSSGCNVTMTEFINVNPLPNITAASSAPNQICVGEKATLTAGGNAISFQWISNTSPFVLMGSSVNVNPTTTTIYTVTGTDANGCEKSTTIVQNVDACTGIKQNTESGSVRIYPNPTAGEFTIEHNNSSSKTILITDLSGRLIYTTTSSEQVIKLNIKDFANGIYYVKIQSGISTEVVKIVKQ
jgi:hypothetical protein